MEQFHTNTEISINGNLSLTSGRDTALKGAVIAADSATLDIGRDLTIVSQVDTVGGSNSSKGFNASLSIGLVGTGSGASAGVKGGKGRESKVWVAQASGVVTDNALDIKVVRGTQITGGVIASYSGDLALETETLVTKDIALHDNKRQLDGSVGVNVGVSAQGGGSGEATNGSDGGLNNGVSNPKFKIEGKYANREVIGIAKATIGRTGGPSVAGQDAERSTSPRTDGGPDGPAEYRQNKIIVRSQTEAETKTQLAAINRDPDSVIEITSFKDEGFELYVSDTAVRAIGDVLRALGDKVTQLAARGDISPEQAEILRKIAICSTQQHGTNYWNPMNWLVTPAYAAEDCSSVTRNDILNTALKRDTLEKLVEICEDPNVKALAKSLLARKIFQSLVKNGDHRRLVDYSLGQVGDLSPDQTTLLRLMKDVLVNGNYRAISYLNNTIGGGQLLINAAKLGAKIPATSPGGYNLKGLSYDEALAVIQLEEAVSLAAGGAGGALVGKVLSTALAKFGPHIVNKVQVIFKKGRGAPNTAIIGGKTCVYSCVVDGTTRYVGITDEVARRGAEHLSQKGIRISGIRGLDNLLRADAHAVEQTLINYYGLGKNGGTLLNKINSISPTRNPTAYEQSLIRGKELLDGVDYQWTN